MSTVRSGGVVEPDDLDHRLIAQLRANSRTPVAELARTLGINRSTVTLRIDRLVSSGVIEAFTIRLANDVDQNAIRGITLVSAEPHRGQEIVRIARGYPEVEHLASTIGVWDLVIQLRTADLADFDRALERIRSIPGVRDTLTSLLFNARTER